MNTKEVFKDIPGYEGHYQVSNHGRIKSLKWNKETIREPTHKRCAGAKTYLQICLSINSKMTTYTVHKLVMETFRPVLSYETINHIDGNKDNNHISNLEYTSNIDNNQKYLKSKGITIHTVYDRHTRTHYQSLMKARQATGHHQTTIVKMKQRFIVKEYKKCASPQG